MSAPYATNPLLELNGLLDAITAAVAGAIVRDVSVRNRDYDGFYTGPWPLIMLRDMDFNLQRISGGVTGLKGQQGREQNFYSIEIQDVIDPRDTGMERVAASQTDILLIESAILTYFDSVANQQLPDANGNPRCHRAGEFIRFKATRPFQSEDGGEVRVVKAGYISVLGLPRQGVLS